MFKRIHQWIEGSSRRRWTAALLGAAAFIAGITFIIHFAQNPSPPDPAIATKAQIVVYLRSDIGSRQREQFLRAEANRFGQMSVGQRQQFERQMGPTLMARIKSQRPFTNARRLANEYRSASFSERAHILYRVFTGTTAEQRASLANLSGDILREGKTQSTK